MNKQNKSSDNAQFEFGIVLDYIGAKMNVLNPVDGDYLAKALTLLKEDQENLPHNQTTLLKAKSASPEKFTKAEKADLFFALAKNNRRQLKHSVPCACFYCLRIFSASLIAEWVQKKYNEPADSTALCPYCSVDAVLPVSVIQQQQLEPSVSGGKLQLSDTEILHRINEICFSEASYL